MTARHLAFGVALGLALALATAAPPAAAQQPAPTRSSLLLGVSGCGQYGCGALSTVLIVREGDRVRIAARGAGLLVPRRDGFWWVGVEQGSTPHEEEAGPGVAPCDSTSSEAPADSARRSDAPDTSDADFFSEYEETPAVLWARRADAADSSAPHTFRTGGGSRLHPTWVGSEWFALTEESVSAHGRSYVSDVVARFAGFLDPSPDSAWSFDPSGPAFERAEAACRRETEPALAIGADSSDAEPDELVGVSFHWTVRRGATRWLVQQVRRGFHTGEEWPTGCPLPRELAASVVGFDRVTVPWSAIKDVRPSASTAFQSPSGDLLLVREDSTWWAYLPRGRARGLELGPAVARFEIRGEPVMAQWAVGAHAARWTREATPLLGEGAPIYVPAADGKR